MRGLFIKHGARLKKAKGNGSAQLLQEIEQLEKQLKQALTREIAMDLTKKRLELRTLLKEQTLKLRDKSRTLFYQYGNKPSKLLARALRQRVNTTSIVKIKSETGDMKYEPKEILKAFHNFYSQLYNKPNQLAEKDPVKFQQNIRQYINETAIPTLTSVEIE